MSTPNPYGQPPFGGYAPPSNAPPPQYYSQQPNPAAYGAPGAYPQPSAPLNPVGLYPQPPGAPPAAPAWGVTPPPPGIGGHPPFAAPVSAPPVSAPSPAASSPRPNVQFFSIGGHAAAPVTGPVAGQPFGPPSTGGFAPPPSSGYGASLPPPPMSGAVPASYGPGIGPPPSGPPLSGSTVGVPSASPGPMPGTGAVFHAVPPSGPPISGFSPTSAPRFVDREGGSQPGQPIPGAAQLPGIHEMDMSIQCNPAFIRSTVGKISAQQVPGQGSRVPLGIVIRPMALDDEDPDFVEVVDFGTTGIVRCKKCRTYINPFVSWVDNGRRWKCNICGLLNDTPSTYFSHLDSNGHRRDRDQRPELKSCSVEFIAPSEYMVRPPQSPVYVFVIDVSAASVSSGMIHSIVNALKRSLDNLPGDERTQIGFITFDSSVHFYNLASTHAHPQMLCVSDIDDIILPTPADLLVNLTESRVIVNSFLDALPNMFINTQNTDLCLGAALHAAQSLMGHIGGKLCVFVTGLCTLGMGALKIRENPRLVGTDKEHNLLNAEESFYKNRAVEFSRMQICTELFVCTSQYCDLATISVLPRYTAGTTYYYPAFYGVRDGVRFEADIDRCLGRATAFEAVFRVRATRGLRISHFYGNYFVRGTDLLALPNCTPDASFAMDLVHDEHVLQASVVTIQAALLYTSAKGERRIRVHTTVLPVTNDPQEVVDSADVDTIVNLIAKQAADVATKTGFEQARTRLHQVCVDMLRDPRGVTGPYTPAPQQTFTLPVSLQLLPLYAMSLQKNPAFRGGNDVRIDERAYYLQLVGGITVEDSRTFVYPRMFSVHDMPTESGLPASPSAEVACAGVNRYRLPNIVNLTHERLTSDGVFLLDTAHELLLRVGRDVNPSILNALFGVSTLEQIDFMNTQLRAESSDFTQRLCAVIDAIRSERPRFMALHIVKEGDAPMEAFFARYLVEDRANFPGGTLSYIEYMGYVTRQAAGHPG